MSRIFVSGLTNVETNCRVGGFPIEYAPVDYNFFGVTSSASGVGLNVALALTALGDKVTLASFAAEDAAGTVVRSSASGIAECRFTSCSSTPQSVVLYDGGRRRVYTDLKDIQERELPDGFSADFADYDAFCLCNINFSRGLLPKAKAEGKPIFCDVHCLGDIRDGYNADFMRYADVLFLSNENIAGREEEFVRALADEYPCKVFAVGMGAGGALLYTREGGFKTVPAVYTREVVNTVGAGDALFSAFTHFYTGGCDAERSLGYAAAFASYKIGESGAAKGFLSEDELFGILR